MSRETFHGIMAIALDVATLALFLAGLILGVERSNYGHATFLLVWSIITEQQARYQWKACKKASIG